MQKKKNIENKKALNVYQDVVLSVAIKVYENGQLFYALFVCNNFTELYV